MGKSTLMRRLHAALGRDDVVLYDGDDNPSVHLRYDAIRRRYGYEGRDRA